MRRLGTTLISAALICLLVFAALLPRISHASPDTPPNTSVPLVLAQNIAARALAIQPNDSSGTLLLTNAGSPDRIFALASDAYAASNSTASAAIANTSRPLAAFAGNGTPGSLGDGGSALSAQFDFSTDSLVERSGIAIAPDGTVYVADTQNSTIRSIASAASTEPGIVRSVAGRWSPQQSVKLIAPIGIAVDRDGNLFIVDRTAGTIVRVASSTGDLDVLAHIVAPSNIAVTANGKIFVASAQTGGVFSIDTQSLTIAIVPGFMPVATDTSASESGVTSPCASLTNKTPSATGNTAIGPAAQPCPAGLAADAAGNLFVSDAVGGRVLRVDAKTNSTTTIASGLSIPGALAIDATGNLYISEQGRTRLLVMPRAAASQGNISLTPASASYINEPTGGTTPLKTFTLTNSSATIITGLNISMIGANSSDFVINGNSCGPALTLGANSSCTVNVAFAPQATGVRSSTLNITDSSSGDLATSAVSGTGDDFELQVPANGTNTVSVAVGNTATFNAVVVPDSVFGANGEKVTFICPSNLPNGVTCEFSPATVSVIPGTAAAFKIYFTTTNNGGFSSTLPASYRLKATLVSLGRLFSGGGDGTGNSDSDSHTALPVSLALILGAASILAMNRRWPRFAVLALMAGTILAGCHHSTAAPTATPVASTNMTVVGDAYDANGNSLNAGRSLSITLDTTAN